MAITTRQKPNFVIVMPEQFGTNVCAGYGNNAVHEPHIASLVSESIRFEQAFCPAPVCGPSRFAFLTGNYVCNLGSCYDNGSAVPDYCPTYAHLLTANGYQTAMCGRMHIHGLSQHVGFERRLASEIIDPTPCCRADWPGALGDIEPLPAAKKVEFTCRISDSPIHKHDDYVTQQACAFMEDYSRGPCDQPFMMTVGYLGAHPGAKGNPEYEQLYHEYMKEDFPVPSFTEQDYDRLGEHVKRRIQYAGFGREIFDPDFHRHELALYYSRCTTLDRQIGMLLETLKATGRDRDTFFILTSDHGEMAGSHGMWGKFIFFDEAQHVPLIVRCPGTAAARSVRGRVSLVDILPTLADLGGVEVNFPVDGLSFAPALLGDQDAPRGPQGAIFSEYHGYTSPGSMYMMIDGPYKYCHYLHAPCELFNIEDDPGEMNNLLPTGDYEAVRARMEAQIRAIVDIEEQEKQIQRYNQRRDAVFAAHETSEIFRNDIEKNIRAFRQERNEPWWDGGQYLAAGEKSYRSRLERERKKRWVTKLPTLRILPRESFRMKRSILYSCMTTLPPTASGSPA